MILADTLEFLGLGPINREFAAFLLLDLGRKTMTQNKLSIHVESGDIFYDIFFDLLAFKYQNICSIDLMTLLNFIVVKDTSFYTPEKCVILPL